MASREETDASKMVSALLALQFVFAMVNALYRSEITPVLCLVGFYAVQERKRNATRTYLIFLVISSFLDVAWLSIYGEYLSDYVNAMTWNNAAQVRVNGLIKVVWW